MNRRIRLLGAVLLVCFGVLFLQLNNYQVLQASSLQNNSRQPRSPVNLYLLPRGDILSADSSVLAYSKPTRDGYGQQRYYPPGTANMFAGITGYYSAAVDAATGIESEYDNYLAQHETAVDSLGQLFTQHKVVSDIKLTVSVVLQQDAQNALLQAEATFHSTTGSVVALDPQTGAILAMYGNPTFDPNQLVVHSYKKVNANAAAIQKLPGCQAGASPLNNGPVSCTFLPGSSFKVIDTAGIFDHKPPMALHYWPPVSSIGPLPDSTQHLRNYGGEVCGGNLPEILYRSCDTAYAEVGMDLGAQALHDEAASFGFNSRPPIDLPNPPSYREVAWSNFPSIQSLLPGGTLGTPGLAYSAIGQENVTATALQMAMVAGAIGNNGVMMTPHLLDHVISNDGVVTTTYKPHAWRRSTSAKTAAEVRKLMLGVTQNPAGTANGVFSGSYQVAAKTGTAETTQCSTNNWLIAFAPAGPGQTPTVAVAAVVPTTTFGCAGTTETTGARVAGPVVATVLQDALAQQAAQQAAGQATKR